MNKDIWVLTEHEQGELLESTIELLCEARKLADSTKGRVRAFLFGNALTGLVEKIATYGADDILVYQGDAFAQYDVDKYLQAFSQAEGEKLLILVSATANGSGFAPRLAARLQCTYMAQAISIKVEQDGKLVISQSKYLNKAHSVSVLEPENAVVITVKPGILGVGSTVEGHKYKVIAAAAKEVVPSKVKVCGFEKADPRKVSLAEAERVVAGGVAFQTEGDISVLQDFADSISAAISGSKPIVDKGLVTYDRLIGQSSGRRLSPKLFVAAGVSGSTHFTEGMKDSRLIIAINKDKGAPIMKLADMAVVGDVYEVLPEVSRQLCALKRKEA